MGASCNRFVRDFLDIDSDDKVLIDALVNRPLLKIRLLIPNDAHMSLDAQTRTVQTLKQVRALQIRFDDRVSLRRFDDEARHSFVIADNDTVAGPIFDDDKSRHAPAVHVATETSFGQKYLAHFNSVWEASSANA